VRADVARVTDAVMVLVVTEQGTSGIGGRVSQRIEMRAPASHARDQHPDGDPHARIIRDPATSRRNGETQRLGETLEIGGGRQRFCIPRLAART